MTTSTQQDSPPRRTEAPQKMAQKKPHMTPDQLAATDPRSTVWVGASAGTGKTHVLTARVLRLMLEGVPPDRILCLTFTKAAASEMQGRVFDVLSGWVLLDDAALSADLHSRAGINATPDQLHLARRLFPLVLDLPAGLNIQNFHSYCTQLLTRFPIEAGTMPGARPIDESEAAALIRQARDMVLAASRRVGEGPLHAAVTAIAARISETSLDGLTAKILTHRRGVRDLVRAHGYAGIGPEIRRRLGFAADDDATTLAARFGDHLASARDMLTATASLMAAATKSFAALGEKLAPVADKLATGGGVNDDDIAAVMAVFLTTEGAPRKSVLPKKIAEDRPDLMDWIAAFQQDCADHHLTLARLEMADASTALMVLAARLTDAYDQLKAQQGRLDFQDLIDRVVTMFGRGDMAPWVMFKLDSQIDHILVDEAQDTNGDQWRVVEALSAEFFAGESARSDILRSVFAVGDDKQSIMGFQGADPAQFLAARDRIFARAADADMQAVSVPLNRSFRSGAAVLALVDAVFADGQDARTGLSLDADTIRHDYSRRGAGGSVTLWPMLVPKESAGDGSAAETQAETQPDTGWQLPTSSSNSVDTGREAAQMIADHIAGRIAANEILPTQGRVIEARDILILVRRRGRFYDQLSRALKERGVPVAGRDQMRLLEELPVLDILALCAVALQPHDDLTLAAVLKSPLIGLTEDALFDLAHGRGRLSLFQRLEHMSDRPDIKDAHEKLFKLIAGADTRSVVSYLAHILGPLKGRKALKAVMGAEVDEPLDALLEAAQAYEDTHSTGLQGFLSHMHTGGATIKRDAEAVSDSVRIMTAHGAKGLQAPIVYVTETVAMASTADDTQLLPDNHASLPALMWSSGIKGVLADEKAAVKDGLLGEYRRLLYVALTRAEDELHILGWRGKRAADGNCWYRAVEAAFDTMDGVDTVDIPVGLGGGLPGVTVRRFAVPHTADVKPKDRAQVVPVDIGDTPWLLKSAAPEVAPYRPLGKTQDDDAPPSTSPLERGRLSPADRGTLIHQLLEWAPALPPETRADRIAAWLAQPGLGIAPPLQAEVSAAVLRVLTHEDYAPLFGPGSRAEVALSGLVGGQVVSARIDRLLVTKTSVTIIDYKTHRHVPQSANGIAADILDQMRLYSAVIRDIYPGRAVKTGVLFTEKPQLFWIDKEKLS